MVGNVRGMCKRHDCRQADIKEQGTVFKFFKGKESEDTADEKPDDCDAMELHLPPFPCPTLQNVPDGYALSLFCTPRVH